MSLSTPTQREEITEKMAATMYRKKIRFRRSTTNRAIVSKNEPPPWGLLMEYTPLSGNRGIARKGRQSGRLTPVQWMEPLSVWVTPVMVSPVSSSRETQSSSCMAVRRRCCS